MRFFVLASAFCLLTSPGLAALPDTTHNVGVGEILAPRGSVDSGLPVIPRIIVNNYGTATETLWTFMRIGTYLDSAEVIGLQGRSSDSVSFRSWTPACRDSMEAVSWTVCARDSFPEDDTARTRFLVRVLDVAVLSIDWPPDTLDSGVVVYPRATFANHGSETKSFRVDIWGCTARVRNLIPGGQQQVVTPDSFVAMPGVYFGWARAMLVGDMHPEDNILMDTLCVRGAPSPVELQIVPLSPLDTIDTLTVIVPCIELQNWGNAAVSGMMWVTCLRDTGRTVYGESLGVALGPGGVVRYAYPSARFRTPGAHTAVCSLHVLQGLDTTVIWPFWVVPRVPYLGGLESLFGPPDTVNLGDSLCFGSYFHNRMPGRITAPLFWLTYDPSGTLVICEETLLSIPGRCSVVTAWELRFSGRPDTGPWMVRESTYAYEFDSLRAVVDWRFWLRGVGLEEGPKPRCSFLPAPATLVRGVLFLPEADGEGRVADGVLLAVTGRAVMALRPGGNDVRHLPSGVYFLRMASGEGRTANSKVVIQR